MKNLLLATALLLCSATFAQNWEDLGPVNAFGNTNDMQIAICDDGTPYVATINTGGGVELFVWNDHQWNPVLNPFSGTATNLQLVNHADTLYIGYSTLASNYNVWRWTSGSANFTQLGDLSTVNVTLEPNSTEITVNPTTHMPMLALYRPDIQEDDMDVYVWDGANWNLHGNPGFCYWGDPDIANIRTVSNGDFTYVFANQFDMGGAFVTPGNNDKPAQQVNNQGKAFGLPELGLYRIDEMAPSNWDVVTGSYLSATDDPSKMEIACNPGKEPVGIYTLWGQQNTMHMFRPNGLGPLTYEIPPFTAPTNINELDIQMMNNDSAIVFIQHDNIAPENSHVYIENGGTLQEVGAPGVSGIYFQDSQLEISRYTNKPYVLWWDGTQTGVRVFNQTPTFNSNTPANPVCQDVVDFVAIDEIIFDDPDHDSCAVWVVSQSPAIVQTSNITVAHSQAWDPSMSANAFSISVTPEPGMNGTVNIDVYCSDGIDTIFTSTSFDVYGLPSASISLPSNQICENHGATVLDNYGIPAGGNFQGTAVYNNTLYPAQAGVGSYNLDYIYQDANGCKDTANQIIQILDIPSVSMAITDADCGQQNGGVDATISGGTGPYTIYWSNGSSLEDISGVAPSMYYINITDANGCYVMDAATVSSNGLSVSGVKVDVDCNGGNNGSIDLNVSGSGPFSYQWSNGATTEDISGLSAGQYEVFVSDGTGCQAMESITINEPAGINANFVLLEATCGLSDGGITLNAAGGTGAYTYQWFDGSMTPFGPNSNVVTGVPSDNYSVQVTDMNGCSQMFNGVLPEAGGPVIIPMMVQDAGCTDDGAIDIAINSNNGVQSIQWSNGPTTEDINGLMPGYYSVVVTDINGCVGMAGIQVDPAIPNATEICVVTVDTSTNTNLIVWEKPVTTEISHWNLYRESSVAGVFQFVDSILYSEDSEYNDTIAYPSLRSWRYVLKTVNDCGVESYASPEHKTIHLVINAGLPGDFNLSWDAYEGFTYPTYFIYRHTDQLGWVEIQQLPFGSGSMTDTPPTIDGLDYLISVDPPATCTSSGKAQDYNSSRSNNSSSTANNPLDDSGVAENTFGLSIFPNPSEDIFKLMFDDYMNYTIQVFDLSGQLIIDKTISAQSYVLDMSGYAKGSYTVKIQTENATVVEKLILR